MADIFLDSQRALRGIQTQTDPTQPEPELEPMTLAQARSFAIKPQTALASPEPEQPSQPKLERVGKFLTIPGQYIDLAPPKPVEEQTEPESSKGDFARNFEKSWEQAKQTGYGTTALIGDTVGNERLRNWGLEGYEQQSKKVEGLTKPSDSITSVWEGKGDIVDWMQGAAGYLTGQVLEFGASALAGAAVGSVLPGAGTVGGAVTGFVQKEAAKQGIKASIAKMLQETFEKKIVQGMTEEAAAKVAGKAVMTAMGAKAGSFLASSTMELGSIYGDAVEQAHKTGEDYNLGKIWLTGIGAAALDTAMDWMSLKKLGNSMGGTDGAKSFLKETFKTGAREGITEGLQTAIERYGADKSLTDSEAIRDYLDSAALGAFGGSVIGGSSAVLSKMTSENIAAPDRTPQNAPQATETPGQGGGSTSTQTEAPDASTFVLERPQLRGIADDQPELIAAAYQTATDEEKQEIVKAMDRLEVRDAIRSVYMDKEALVSGLDALNVDQDYADFLKRSLVKLGQTPPTDTTTKVAPKFRPMTEDDLNRMDEEIRQFDARSTVPPQNQNVPPEPPKPPEPPTPPTPPQNFKSKATEEVIKNGGFVMNLDEVAVKGDESWSPWLMADGTIIGSRGDHISVTEEGAYTPFMKRTGAVRASFFPDSTGAYAIMLHVANGQQLTDEQKSTVASLAIKNKNAQIMLGESDADLANPEYRPVSIDQLLSGKPFSQTQESSGATDGASVLENQATGKTNIDYGQFKFSNDEVKNGFMSLGVDPGMVIPTGKRGVYTQSDLLRTSISLDALTKAQQAAQGVDVRLATRKIDASKVSVPRQLETAVVPPPVEPNAPAQPNASVPTAPAADQNQRVILTGSSPYLGKDQKKADVATKFIGRGSPNSSTASYAKNFGDRANSGAYTAQDAVFVSAEGNRSGRVEPDFAEIKRAMDAGAAIITDDAANRNRPYNIGERQVADFLSSNGYAESAPGRWTPNQNSAPVSQPTAPAKEPVVLDKFEMDYGPVQEIDKLLREKKFGRAATLFRQNGYAEKFNVDFRNLVGGQMLSDAIGIPKPEIKIDPVADGKALDQVRQLIRSGKETEARSFFQDSQLMEKGYGQYDTLRSSVSQEFTGDKPNIAREIDSEESLEDQVGGRIYKKVPKKKSTPRQASIRFEENYQPGSTDTAKSEFSRIVDVLSLQYLRGMDVDPSPDRLTGPALEIFSQIPPESYDKKLVTKMLRNTNLRNIQDIAAKTGKPRTEYQPDTPEKQKARKFKADVARVMLRLEQATPYQFMLENLEQEEKAISEAMRQSDQIVDGDERFVATNDQFESGGIMEMMENPSGRGERAGERRMVEIRSGSELRKEQLAQRAAELRDDIKALREGKRDQLVSVFKKRMDNISKRIKVMMENAISDGVPEAEARKIANEARNSIESYKNREYSEETPVKETPVDDDQTPFEGPEAAKKLAQDFVSGQTGMNVALRTASEQIRAGEYTVGDLITAIRRTGTDVPMELVKELAPLPMRIRMADYVRQMGGAYVYRNEWMRELRRSIKTMKAKGITEWRKHLDLTPGEIALYENWLTQFIDLNSRRTKAEEKLPQNMTSFGAKLMRQNIEEAFPHLLFSRYHLDQMKDLRQVKSVSERTHLSDVFGDSDGAVEAWMSDLDWAVSNYPQLKDALLKTDGSFLPKDEIEAYKAWKEKTIERNALRERERERNERMVRNSTYFLALNQKVPHPDNKEWYAEAFKKPDVREKKISEARAIWRQFTLASASQREKMLENASELSDLISEVQDRPDDVFDDVIADWQQKVTSKQGQNVSIEEDDDAKTVSFVNLATEQVKTFKGFVGPDLADEPEESNFGPDSDLSSSEIADDEDFESLRRAYESEMDQFFDKAGDGMHFGDARRAVGDFSGTQSAATVGGWVAEISRDWNGGPEITVLQNPSQLPEQLREALGDKLGEGFDAKGLYVTDSNKVYVFSDYVTGKEDTEWTVFHETYGHFGMRALLGKGFDSFLQSVYLTRPEIRKAADLKSREQGLGVLESVEEVLADKAGDAKYGGVFKQMAGRLIRWLRDHGFKSVADYLASKTDAEVAYVLKSARDAVHRGVPAAFRGAPFDVRLAQQQRTPYEMFALKDGKTEGYARFDPVRNVWYVFSVLNGNMNTYNIGVIQDIADVQKYMRKLGKVESRLRSGLYIDNKLVADLARPIPDYREEPKTWKRMLDNLTLNVQNEYLPIFKVVDHLSKNGRVTDAVDVRKDLSGLYERKTAAELEAFRQKYVEPIIDLVKDAKRLGADDDFINKYAVARHAEERNRQVKKINPKIDHGSGMAPNRIYDAQGNLKKEGYLDVMREAQQRGLTQTLERIGQLTDRMADEKLAIMVRDGLLHPREADARRGAYRHYVNLSGQNDALDKFSDPSMFVTGKKFNLRGKDKRAMGRGDIAPDVIARTISAYESAIIRGQKNVVAQRLLALMEMNYDPNFVTINKLPIIRKFDTERYIEYQKLERKKQNGTITAQEDAQMRQMGADGFVFEEEDTSYINNKSVMIAKVKGAPVMMEFKQTGKNSFAEAVHGSVYPKDSGYILNKIGDIQQRIGRMLTTWNPVWVGVNYIRDVQTLMFNAAVDGRIGKDKAAQMVKRTLPAGRAAIYSALQDFHPTTATGKKAKAFIAKMVGQPNPAMLRWLDEARKEGALTSFIDRKGLEEQVHQIYMAMHGKSPMEKVEGFFSFMELMTIPMEMGPRLAAYSVVREAGWSKRDAAFLAGEITVNFNMRGKQAWLRQLYLFFNPAIQGTAKMVSLAKNDPKRFAVAAAAFAGLGMLVSMAGRMFSDDDDDGINKLDKVPPFKRATSAVLAADVPGMAIPIPYGWNSFFSAGSFGFDTAVGAQPLLTTAKRVAIATYEAFLPLGASGLESNKGPVVQALKAAAPTLMLPMVEYAVNENRFGAPIRKEGFPGQTSQPDAYMSFRSVNPISRVLAEGANNLTGGHRFKEGVADFNPAFIDHAINAYLPGFISEVYKGAGQVVRAARGENLKDGALPVIGRFTADVTDAWDSSAYMRVRELVNAKWAEYEKAPNAAAQEEVRREYKGLGEAKEIVKAVDGAVRKVEARYNAALLAVDRGQGSTEQLVRLRNEMDEQKKKLYHRAIGAAMKVGEGDNHPIRDALLGG